jgi:hypothetical protein
MISQAWQRKRAFVAASLRAQSEQDSWLDIWRRLVQDARESVLHADRASLLLIFERAAAAWLPDFLCARSVDPEDPAAVPAGGATSPTADAGRRVAIVDARRHPREWHINALAAQLQAIMAPAGEAAGKGQDAGAWLRLPAVLCCAVLFCTAASLGGRHKGHSLSHPCAELLETPCWTFGARRACCALCDSAPCQCALQNAPAEWIEARHNPLCCCRPAMPGRSVQ